MTQPDTETIHDEMARIRCKLGPHTKDVIGETRRLANWRTYLHDYPWACVGAAVAIGFLAVPSRPKILSPDADDLAALAQRNQLVVKQFPKGTTSQSLARTSATFLSNIVLRSAVAYLGQQIGKFSQNGSGNGKH